MSGIATSLINDLSIYMYRRIRNKYPVDVLEWGKLNYS